MRSARRVIYSFLRGKPAHAATQLIPLCAHGNCTSARILTPSEPILWKLESSLSTLHTNPLDLSPRTLTCLPHPHGLKADALGVAFGRGAGRVVGGSRMHRASRLLQASSLSCPLSSSSISSSSIPEASSSSWEYWPRIRRPEHSHSILARLTSQDPAVPGEGAVSLTLQSLGLRRSTVTTRTSRKNKQTNRAERATSGGGLGQDPKSGDVAQSRGARLASESVMLPNSVNGWPYPQVLGFPLE